MGSGMLLPLLELIAWPGAGRIAVSALLEDAIALAVAVPFTVWLLRATRRKPPITSSADRPPNQFGPPPRSPWVVLLTGALALAPSLVRATPSTTYWAPSTANCQAWKTPHVTYDNYFGRGPAAGSQGAPNYPIDTGLTMGVLPSNKVQAEAGFDLLLPSPDPLFLNAKLCTPESSLFKGSPSLSAGIYNLGFKDGVTDYNVLHFMAQKAIGGTGYIAAGLYHGLGNESLFTNSEGKVVRTGAMAGLFSPDIKVGMKGLKKINLTADVQTGKNVLGAGGVGVYLYFTDTISLLTGPVFFFDRALQPGGRRMLWTVQADVDVPLGRK